MDKQGYIDYNLLLSSNNSGKADSYARALKIIEDILPYQDTIQLNGKSIFEISDIRVIESLENYIRSRRMQNISGKTMKKIYLIMVVLINEVIH